MRYASRTNKEATMSATVLGCGHTSHLHLSDIKVLLATPHIHQHFWTGLAEYQELGYGKVELCCHGCGASLLVYYRHEETPDRHQQIQNTFIETHKYCPNHGYQRSCPDWRSSFTVLDIRQTKLSEESNSNPTNPLSCKRKRRRSLLPLKTEEGT